MVNTLVYLVLSQIHRTSKGTVFNSKDTDMEVELKVPYFGNQTMK